MQENEIHEQTKVNQGLYELSKELDIPTAATNDCHYIDRKDARAHEILMAIQTGTKLESENKMRLKLDTSGLYLKSPEEMSEQFAAHPEALENAAKIAASCNVELQLGKFCLPKFKPPDGSLPEDFIRKVAIDGLKSVLMEKMMKSILKDLIMKLMSFVNLVLLVIF